MATVDIWVKPLTAGERMSREEFLGRWDLLPEVKRAELIHGVVRMSSPLSVSHGSAHCDAIWWLKQYSYATPGCEVLAEASWLIGQDVPQPDASLHIPVELGGTGGRKGALAAGVPELVVEVSVSSESFDLGEKRKLYESAGVPEYIVVVADSRLVWHRLEGGRYFEVAAGGDGIHRSSGFPGLWLDAAALLAGDGARLLEVLNRGLATPEHAVFVERLAARRR